ncbi:MAG: ATP-binding protein [Candidatus Moranbacteria bacterium]|nr:ATP-binding protein [Candidatus Moranbacteria bacterium]
MICYLFSKPLYFIFSSDVPSLLYYSHIPTAIVAILIGIFVFWKGKQLLINRLLFAISACFSLWVILNLILWTNIHSDLMLFVWSFLRVLSSLISILSIYFIYVFLGGKDVSFRLKIIFLILTVPIIILSSTYINLRGFNIASCDAFMFEGPLFQFSRVFFGVLAMIWIFVLLIRKYRTAEVNFRKQILLMGVGMELFLFSFFMVTFLAAYLTDMGLVSDSRIEFYGLFGMDIFVAFLAYLIVRYKTFNIKLIATQALVIALIILIGSQIFFAQSLTNTILIGVTLIISLAFGYMLVRSVNMEVQRKEELEILSTKLAQANDKLHQLDKTKSEFISIASHQLRTPLTAIKGFVSLLLEGTYGQVPETQKGALEKVYISNERLVQLVEDLLNISRIESGRMEFDFQEAQIEDLITEAANTLDLSAKNKGLYLEWKKPEKISPKIKIDITKVKEVISNMIDNSIKYTQKGGVTVRMENGVFFDHNTMERKNVLRVIVSDTGIGMEKEDIENIFDKFVRGKEISHYHTDGTGLGMFIAKKVTEAHQGKIWAESAGKGKGSRFILELPVNIT